MMRECHLAGIPVIQQMRVEIEYKGQVFADNMRLDLLVDDCLIVELKAVEKILPIHKAQLLRYMKLLDKPLGLPVKFNALLLKNELHRLILPGAHQ